MELALPTPLAASDRHGYFRRRKGDGDTACHAFEVRSLCQMDTERGKSVCIPRPYDGVRCHQLGRKSQINQLCESCRKRRDDKLLRNEKLFSFMTLGIEKHHSSDAVYTRLCSLQLKHSAIPRPPSWEFAHVAWPLASVVRNSHSVHCRRQ